ncbi:MAG: hypothetical protein ACRCT6_08535, partial [Notoacmeibacter sp.]
AVDGIQITHHCLLSVSNGTSIVISVCFGVTKFASANTALYPMAKIAKSVRINRVSVGILLVSSVKEGAIGVYMRSNCAWRKHCCQNA